MDQKIEEKIYFKAKNIFDAYLARKASPVNVAEANKKTFLIDITGAMAKILKAEVNIRIQEAKHHPIKNTG